LISDSPPRASWWTSIKPARLVPLFGWWNEYKKSKVGVAGLAIALIFIVVIIFAPLIATHDPNPMTPEMQLPPSWDHLLGTTTVGRDIFSQLVFAGRISFFIGVVGSLGVVLVGSIIGILAGYFGGLADEILTRVMDILLVLPRLPLMIILAAFMGPGMNTIFFVVVVLGWTRVARQIRAMTFSVKEYTFVEASRAAGASHKHIMWYHILPNILGVAIANFVLEVVTVIMLEAGLSFLGLGDPLHESWGIMLYFAQEDGAFGLGMWWWWLPPGAAICLLGMAFSFIGNTINDRFVLRLRTITMKKGKA